MWCSPSEGDESRGVRRCFSSGSLESVWLGGLEAGARIAVNSRVMFFALDAKCQRGARSEMARSWPICRTGAHATSFNL